MNAETRNLRVCKAKWHRRAAHATKKYAENTYGLQPTPAQCFQFDAIPARIDTIADAEVLPRPGICQLAAREQSMNSMNAEQQKPKPEPKRLSAKGCLLIGLGVVVLTVLISCLGVISWRAQSARRAEAMLAEIQKRGEPVTAAELNTYYTLPEGAFDATELWVTAIAPLDGAAFSQDAKSLPIVGTNVEIPLPGQPWQQMADVEAFLEKYAESLQRMHQAADRGGAARYDLEFEQGFAMPLVHAQRLRGGARLLSLEAHVRAHRGDARGVADSIHAICMLGNSLEQEPVLVSQLVRIAVGGISGDLFRRLLPHMEFSDADLKRLAKDFRTTRYNDGFRRSLIGERGVGIQAFRNPAGDDADSQSGVGPMFSLNRNDDLCQYLGFFERMIAAAKKPIPQARNEFDQIEQDLAALGKSNLNRVRYMLTTLLLPAVGAGLDAVARGNSMNDAAMTAIAIERYRRDRGQIPDDLKQLVPEFLLQVPTDAFDGKPLRYVVKDGEYLIYSVGKDGVDNGGQGDFDPDIVFRVERTETNR